MYDKLIWTWKMGSGPKWYCISPFAVRIIDTPTNFRTGLFEVELLFHETARFRKRGL